LGTIMEAKKLLLFAFGKNKADAVRELVEGSVSAVWPATIIQMHPDVTVLLDQDAARYLRFKDLYQTRWELVK
ncbi:MAG: glucosamine-6-phosphate deaminase, partial [Varibaculum cambriense]|nr:glucosamine-6-phosphate deaminase [Varibaculum cambriense]